MKDSIIEERLYKKSSVYVNNNSLLLEARESHKISLRKQKISEILSIKRKNQIAPNSKFEPYINEAEIPSHLLNPNIINSTETKAFSLLKIYLLYLDQYKKPSPISFFILKRINENIPLLSTETVENDINRLHLIDKIFFYLSNNISHNKIVIYLVYTIFHSISLYSNEDLMDKFVNVIHLETFVETFSFLSKSFDDNVDIIQTMILFIGNLLPNNNFVQSIFYEHNIYSLILQCLTNETYASNCQIVKECIGFFVRFASLKTFPDAKCVNELYSIFLFYLTNVDLMDNNTIAKEEIISDCIWGLDFITFSKEEEVLNDIISKDIVNDLINLCNIYQSIIRPTVQILGNLSSLSDDNCKLMYNEKCSQFLIRNLLYNSHIIVKIEVLWVIMNVCIGTNMSCLFQFDLYENMLNYLYSLITVEKGNLKVQSEILKTIVICMNNTNERNLMVNDKVIEIICEILHRDNYNDDIIIILIALIEIVFQENNAHYVQRLKNANVNEIVNKWTLEKNEDVQNGASELMDKFL